MPRATNVPAAKRRRKRVIKKAKGYFGNKSRLFRYAQDALARSGQFAYRARKRKKNEYRQLWIVRLNAAVRPLGMTYSRFMAGVIASGVTLDRKALSELAIHDPAAFAAIVERAKKALTQKAAA